MNPLTAPLARTLALVALVLVPLLGAAAPASAATYSGSGWFGPVVSQQGTCRHTIFGASSTLRMTVPSPEVYTYNYRSGWGNDGAWVRYRAFLVDAHTGATVTSTGWSGFVWAQDNAPARFGLVTTFSGASRGFYHVDYRVEFWGPGATAPYAWAAHRVDRWKYVSYTNVEGGIWPSCFKYT